MGVDEERRNTKCRIASDVPAVVHQLSYRVVREKPFESNEIFRDTYSQCHEIKRCQEHGKLVQFLPFQTCADQKKGQQERITAQTDQLNQRILDGYDRKIGRAHV